MCIFIGVWFSVDVNKYETEQRRLQELWDIYPLSKNSESGEDMVRMNIKSCKAVHIVTPVRMG